MSTTRTSSLARRAALAVSAVAILPLTLTACGDGDKKDAAAGPSASEPAAPAASSTPSDMTPMNGPFGPGCAGVPKEGKGSFDGMAK
ncbi:hypothetical protein ACIQM4_26355, partial [Streptomyces sp. NPDC091272]